jgi:hypothetical protein
MKVTWIVRRAGMTDREGYRRPDDRASGAIIVPLAEGPSRSRDAGAPRSRPGGGTGAPGRQRFCRRTTWSLPVRPPGSVYSATNTAVMLSAVGLWPAALVWIVPEQPAVVDCGWPCVS